MGQVHQVDNDVDPHGRDGAQVLLQQHLAEVCAWAAAICVTDYESSPSSEIDGLVTRTTSLVRSALEALDVVAVLYGDDELDEAPSDASFDAGDRVSWTPPPVPDPVIDTVTLARMGLRSRLRRLTAPAGSSTPLERVALAGGALRTIQKSLNAVDRSMCTEERPPATVDFYDRHVERSLAIRRQYVELHRMVVRASPPSLEVRARMRRAGNAIARILGLPIAAHMRTGDRALLMMMHSRVRDWLAAPRQDEAHVAEGERLWQDIANLATMFLDVSRREELVEHDARLAGDVLCRLPVSASGWDEAASADTLRRLSTMRGRSAALDALLDGAAPALDVEEVRRLLVSLRQSLAPAAATTADLAPPSGPRLVMR